MLCIITYIILTLETIMLTIGLVFLLRYIRKTEARFLKSQDEELGLRETTKRNKKIQKPKPKTPPESEPEQEPEQEPEPEHEENHIVNISTVVKEIEANKIDTVPIEKVTPQIQAEIKSPIDTQSVTGQKVEQRKKRSEKKETEEKERKSKKDKKSKKEKKSSKERDYTKSQTKEKQYKIPSF